MAQQLFYFILFLNNNIIITSNKIMWGITIGPSKNKTKNQIKIFHHD